MEVNGHDSIEWTEDVTDSVLRELRSMGRGLARYGTVTRGRGVGKVSVRLVCWGWRGWLSLGDGLVVGVWVFWWEGRKGGEGKGEKGLCGRRLTGYLM